MAAPNPPQQHACPTEMQIADFIAGRLPPEIIDEVAAHVEHCQACQTKLAELDASEASLADALGKLGGELPYTDEAQCLEALQRIERGGSPTQGALRAGDVTLDRPREAETGRASEAARLQQVGEYHLLEPLGEGGMGTVYKARHAAFGSLYAVKLLHPRRRQDQQAIERFQREMVAIGQLDHPNIVRAVDAGDEGDIHYLVMEYVDGVDLSRLAGRHGVLAIADACEMIRQTALGLAYAHRHGRVHRDVKPSNLMLARSEAAATLHSPFRAPQSALIKILDLGLARFGDMPIDEPATLESRTLLEIAPEANNLTLTNQVMGTLEYMAPEQAADSRTVDARSDIYSLGCTLYKLLVGRAPFGELRYSTSAKQMLAHAQAPVPPIRELRADIPVELGALIERMLAKKPADRPASADEVVAALAPFAVGADLASLLEAVADPAREDTEDLQGYTVTMAAVASAPAPIAASPAPRDAWRIPWWPILLSAGAGLFVAGVLLIVVLMQMTMARGHLIVEFDSPDAEAALLAGRVTVVDQRGYRRTLQPGEQLLRPGDYTIETGGSGLFFSPSEFALRRNARQMVLASRVSPDEWDKPSQNIAPQFPAVDLLALIDVERDAARDAWRREGAAIVSSSAFGSAPLQIPYRPPVEYRIEITVERLGAINSLNLGLPIGDRRCRAIVDSWPSEGYLAGPAFLDGKDIVAHRRQAYRGVVIPQGRPVMLSYEVRRRGQEVLIRVMRNAGSQPEEIYTWRGDVNRLSELRPEAPRSPDVLYLWTWESPLRISQLRLVPLSGVGAAVEFADPAAQPDLAAAQRVLWKRGRVWVRQGEAVSEITQRESLPPQFVVEAIEAGDQTWFTASDLDFFANLAHLRRLEFSGSSFPADAWLRLSGLSQLEELDLAGAELVGGAAGRLGDLPRLRRLNLRRALLDDTALAAVARLNELEDLDLSYSDITDAGLTHLASLERLTRLTLDHTAVADKGVALLASLPSLASLSLMGTLVTDGAADSLASLPALREVNLIGTQITGDGAATLRQRLAETEVLTGFDEEIDLLRFVDLEWSEVAHGPWSFKSRLSLHETPPRREAKNDNDIALEVAPHSGTALAPLVISPPEEYDLEFTAIRAVGDDGLVLLLRGGGRTFMPQFDQFPHLGSFTVIDMVDGKRESQNKTHVKGVWFPPGEAVTTVVHVRRDQVRLLRNGEELLAWSADYQRAWVRDYWQPADLRAWGVGAHVAGFRIEALKLRPLSGPAGAIPLHPTPRNSDRQLVERLRALGANVTVTFDGQNAQPLEREQPLPNRSMWVRTIAGFQDAKLTADDFALFGAARQLRTLNLFGATFDDASLASLAGHPSLREMHLGSGLVGAEGLDHVGRIPQLEKLSLARRTARGAESGGDIAPLANLNPILLSMSGDAATDDVLATIGRMTRLTSLNLVGSRASAAGFHHLRRLEELRTLNVRGAQGVGAGEVAALAELPLLSTLDLGHSDFNDAAAVGMGQGPFASLTALWINETRITDEGVQGLVGLSRLRRLSLENTRITDAAVEALVRLRDLEFLSLAGCYGVSDRSMPQLGQLRNLKELRLTGTNITLNGVAQLRAALPDCSIQSPTVGFDLTGDVSMLLPEPTGPPVDLLALIDLDRDAAPGAWERAGSTVISASQVDAWLQIPYAPPKTYRIRAVIERVPGYGREGPNLGLVAGGRQVRLALDGWPHEGYLSGPHLLDGRGLETHRNQAFRGQAIPEGRPVEIVCAVLDRSDHVAIQVEIDGHKRFAWRGAARQLSMDPFHRPYAADVLSLFCYNTRIKFHQLEVTPLSDGGQIVEFADRAKEPDRAAAQRVLWKGGAVEVLRDGAVAEIDALTDLPPEAAITGVVSRGGAWFSDVDLAHLSHLSELERLILAGVPITDVGLEALVDLPKLAELDLSGAALTGSGLAHLRKFPELRRLRLAGVELDDASLDVIAAFSKVTELDLSSTRVTDAGLERLAKLERLTVLNLSRTGVVGDAAAVLGKLPELRSLSLMGAPVADAALDQLAQLTSLRRLSLIDTAMSEQGVAGLRQKLSGCRVASNFDDAIDLLPLVDWSWSIRRGEWTSNGDVLTISPRRPGLLLFPVEPPEEYDLELNLERTAGVDGFALRLVGGGRPFAVEFDQYPSSGPYTTIDMVDGARGSANETSVKMNAMPIGEEVQAVVEVRRDRVRVHHQGKTLIDWPADYNRLGLFGAWRTSEANVLGLGVWQNGFIVRKAVLRPLSGRFNVLPPRPTPATSDRELADWVQTQGGLLGVTFDGRGYQQFTADQPLPNRPLWVLRVDGLADVEVSAREFALFTQAERLQTLNLTRAKFDEAELAQLADHPSLKALLLFDTATTDAALVHVAMIKSLERLNLSRTAVTDAGAPLLANLPRLVELRLADTRVTDAVMPIVAKFQPLTILDLNDAEVTGAALAHIASLSNLRTLYINSARPMTGDDLAQLEKIPQLQHLQIVGAQLTDEDAARLLPHQGLRSLNVSFTGLSDSGVQTLTALPNLRQLFLTRTKITDAAVQSLAAHLPTLEKLWLTSTNVTDVAVPALVTMRGLTELHLDGTRISPHGIARLQTELPNCRITAPPPTFNFAGQHLGDQDLPEALGDVTPEMLVLTGTTITDASMPLIGTLTTLRSLHLENTHVTDSGLLHLAGLVNLASLNLNGTGVTDAGLMNLAPLEQLRELRLGRTQVTGVGFRELGRLPLTVVQLGSAQVNVEGFAHVVAIPTLHYLDVAGADVGDASLAPLAELKDLTFLHLGWTQVRGPGLAHLAGLPKLDRLLINNTPIVDGALDQIAEVPALTFLKLDRTAITDQALTRMAELKKLKHLDLSFTAVTDAGMASLVELTELESLNLTGAQVNLTAARTLHAKLPQCKITLGDIVLTK